MDRIDAMETLIAAVEAGSLSAASRRLRVPLATVSRKVSELEAHLKTQLLLRTSRRLVLTPAGASYLAAARRILDALRAAEADAAGAFAVPRGALTIAAPIEFGRLHVLPVVGAFLAAYPEIDVRLTLSDRNAHLVDDQIDAAVRIGELPDSSLVATRLGTLRRVVCGSPDFFARHGEPKAPRDLSALDWVTFDAAAPARAVAFGDGLSIPVRSRLSVNTAEAAIDAAVAGVGVTRVLSYQSAAAVKAGRLRIVLERFEPARVPVQLVRADAGRVAAKTRAFVDFAAPRLKAALGG